MHMERIAGAALALSLAGLVAAAGGWLDIPFGRMTQLVVALAVLAFAAHATAAPRR